MEKFTIQEFKNYLLERHSLENAMYMLSEANIKIANVSEKTIENDNTDFDEDISDSDLMMGMLGH